MITIAPVEFFPMVERDLGEVARLEASVQAFPWTLTNFEDSLHSGYSCWICRVGGDLVGFSVVMPVVDEAHLLNLGVRVDRQGQGLGARLLVRAMDTARLNGMSSMYLEVRVSNARAAELYRHFGFHEIAIRRAYYPSAAGREDALVMKKDLH